jgi:Holliday junction resolvase
MTNKNYEKGRSFEYELQNKLRKKGWLTTRGAGSHSIDIIALYPGGSKILFLELKVGHYQRGEYLKVAKYVKECGGIFCIVVKVKGKVRWIKL